MEKITKVAVQRSNEWPVAPLQNGNERKNKMFVASLKFACNSLSWVYFLSVMFGQVLPGNLPMLSTPLSAIRINLSAKNPPFSMMEFVLHWCVFFHSWITLFSLRDISKKKKKPEHFRDSHYMFYLKWTTLQMYRLVLSRLYNNT